MKFPLRSLVAVLTASLLVAISGCVGSLGGTTPDSDDPVQARFVEAVRADDGALAEDLLAEGADVDAVDEEGTPLLHRAVRANDRAAADLLLELGADPGAGDAQGRTALHEAAMAPHGDWIDLLLDAGVPVDVPNTRNGQTPIYDALRAREPDNVARLLAAGASMDVRDRTGTTPLHQAALVNDLPSVRLFLEAGADPTAADDTDATVVDYLYDGDPSVLTPQVRRDYEWILERLEADGLTASTR